MEISIDKGVTLSISDKESKSIAMAVVLLLLFVAIVYISQNNNQGVSENLRETFYSGTRTEQLPPAVEESNQATFVTEGRTKTIKFPSFFISPPKTGVQVSTCKSLHSKK